MEKKDLEALKKLPFEKALEELEAIVGQMEGGQLALDDMMKAYEKGQALSAVCSDKLKSIEKKVEILRKKAEGDEWEDFQGDEEQTRAPAPPAAPVAEEPQDLIDESAEVADDGEDLPF